MKEYRKRRESYSYGEQILLDFPGSVVRGDYMTIYGDYIKGNTMYTDSQIRAENRIRVSLEGIMNEYYKIYGKEEYNPNKILESSNESIDNIKALTEAVKNVGINEGLDFEQTKKFNDETERKEYIEELISNNDTDKMLGIMGEEVIQISEVWQEFYDAKENDPTLDTDIERYDFLQAQMEYFNLNAYENDIGNFEELLEDQEECNKLEEKRTTELGLLDEVYKSDKYRDMMSILNGLDNSRKEGELQVEKANQITVYFRQLRNSITEKFSNLKGKITDKFGGKSNQTTVYFGQLRNSITEKFSNLKGKITDKMGEIAGGYFNRDQNFQEEVIKPANDQIINGQEENKENDNLVKEDTNKELDNIDNIRDKNESVIKDIEIVEEQNKSNKDKDLEEKPHNSNENIEKEEDTDSPGKTIIHIR